MEAARKRPVILTIVCILGVLASLGSFIFVFSPFVRKIGNWAPALFGLIIALRFIAFIGIWHMKKWGVMLYTVIFFSDILFAIIASDVNYISIVFGTIFIIFFLVFYRRMSNEL